MITPSTVGVPAVVLSMVNFNRSPAAACHATGGVLSSLGVTPAVPPDWTGLRSWIVSLPEYTVATTPVAEARTSVITWAGQGRYSYCHPDSGLRPSWFAVIALENTSCGITTP